MLLLQNKARLKSLLAGYERNSTVIIAQGLVNHRARRQILADLKKELRKYVGLCRLSSVETHRLWNHSYKTLHRTSKLTWGKKNSTDIYRILKKELIYNKEFTHIKNQIADKHEESMKRDYLKELMDNNETLFYLSDSHKQCAEGHKAYENRIYYDAESSLLTDEILKFVKSQHMMSVQEVIGDGIWFITRPNCGHHLYPVAIDEVMHGRKPRRIITEEYRTATGLAEFYYERGRMLDSLRDALPCSELEKDYLNTLKLERRWRMR